MHRCYVPRLSESELVIDADEAHHMVHVLRMGEGDQVSLFDGRGGRAPAVISFSSKRETRVLPGQIERLPLPERNLHLAVAPTKNQDRLEWLAEKACEIGLRSFIPVLCRHSERKHLNMERIRKVVLSATRQSGGFWLPECPDPVTFESLVRNRPPGAAFIAHCREGARVSLKTISEAEEAVVLIGPEGDFHEQEIAMAMEFGFNPLSLGDKRLRTETAALVATVAFHLR
ncbi:MAG: RsmE family RNA methyltransferase [Bacteroidota bacterium]